METLDLQFNYPVLPGQDKEFGDVLREIAGEAAEAIQLAPWGGKEAHRRAAAEWLSRKGKPYAWERVLIGSGGHNGVMASILAAGMIGKKIAVDPLTYSGFKGQASAIGCEMVPCDGDDDGMLASSLEEAAKAGARAAYLMPTVHNPLGTVMPLRRRQEIVEVARRLDLLIIEDDAYGFMEANPPTNFAELAPERAIYIASMTKPYAPVLKIAFIAVPDSMSAAMAEKLRALSSGASALLGEAAIRLARGGSIERVVEAKRKEAAARQKVAAEILRGIKTRAHPTSYHVWLDLTGGPDALEVERRLNAKNIFIVPAKNFSATSSSPMNGLRVAMGAIRDETKLRGALEQVAAEVRRG